jgi:hypothetical protein
MFFEVEILRIWQYLPYRKGLKGFMLTAATIIAI